MTVEFQVIRGKVLGINVFRGYAKLADLAKISKADIYDQKRNPTGTQRDLSASHARAAYEYVKTVDFAYWPEVFLCARDEVAFEFSATTLNSDIGLLRVNTDYIEQSDSICISRVDGNHRLHYGDGQTKGFTPIDRTISFCMAYGLTLEQEIELFRDINNNQRRMNTSHLDNIETRLTSSEQLKKVDPSLYIAKKLGHDPESPFYNRIYEGGTKPAGYHVPLRTLNTGIKFILSQRNNKLSLLSEVDAQYRVIRNYFNAVKRWQPEAWEKPKQYLLLRGAGLWGVCQIGADVIDKVISKNKHTTEDMLKVLESGKKWDWSNKGEFQGLSGQGGASQIRKSIVSEFHDDEGISVKQLFQQIMDSEK